MMEIKDFGFLQRASDVYSQPPRCFQSLKNLYEKKPRLTLLSLTSAFVILVAGCGIALVVFLFEIVVGKLRKKQQNVQVAN